MMAKCQDEVEDERGLDIKLNEFCEFGKTLGLSDTDIDKCILLSLQKRIQVIQLPRKRLRHCIWDVLANVLKVIVYFTGLICSFYLLMYFHEPTRSAFDYHIQPYTYGFMRLLRLVTLPLSTRLKMSGMYDPGFCILANPAHNVDPYTDCNMCKGVNDVRDFYAELPDTDESGLGPFVLKNNDDSWSEVKYHVLSRAFNEDSNNYVYRSKNVECSNKSANTVEGLFNTSDIDSDSLFHAQWISRQAATAHFLRKFFPRPIFAPPKAEVSVRKTLYIDGSRAKPYSLNTMENLNVWYAQGSGSRTLVLEPGGSCASVCKTLAITLNAGDIVQFLQFFYYAKSLPAGESPSVGFMGSYDSDSDPD